MEQPTASPAHPGAAMDACYAAIKRYFGDLGTGVINFDQRIRNWYQANLRPGDVAIDIGAHTGEHLFPIASCVGETGFVLGFEPIPHLFHNLQARIAGERLTQIRVEPVALSDHNGEIEFNVVENALGLSSLNLRLDMETNFKGSTVKKIPAVILRLDDFALRWMTRLDFVKIDIEGGETNAIAGGLALLERTRPAIAFEHGSPGAGAFGKEGHEIFDMLTPLGYSFYDIYGNLLPDRETYMRSYHEGPCWDYLAVADPRWTPNFQVLA